MSHSRNSAASPPQRYSPQRSGNYDRYSDGEQRNGMDTRYAGHQHRRRSRSPSSRRRSPSGRHGYSSDRHDRDYRSSCYRDYGRRDDHRYARSDKYYDRERSHDNARRPHSRIAQDSMQPNIQVVLRSLPERAEEPDIDKHLKSMGASIEQVNLIRDRDTGESRKFAFVRFTSVGHAVEFMDKYYPYFFMGHQRVRLDYSRKEGNREDAVEWRCSNCGKFNEDSRRACVECRTPFESSTAQKRSNELETIEINDGSRDTSVNNSNMLLLRHLDHLSTEESVYHAVKKFSGVRRVLLIRDKMAKMSCEFAFVEFDNVHYAAKAFAEMNPTYTVDGRQAIVSYAHPDSFLPIYVSSEWAIPADVPDGLWEYWDPQSYASEYSALVEAARARKEVEAKLLEEERRQKELEEQRAKQAKKETKKDTLEDDLKEFYDDMKDMFAEDSGSHTDIFSVPKQ